jgi:hypothetical protein
MTEQPKRYSKGGLYGCLSVDCMYCTDADCTPGAERATEEQAVALGWLTQEQVDAHRERARLIGERDDLRRQLEQVAEQAATRLSMLDDMTAQRDQWQRDCEQSQSLVAELCSDVWDEQIRVCDLRRQLGEARANQRAAYEEGAAAAQAACREAMIELREARARVAQLEGTLRTIRSCCVDRIEDAQVATEGPTPLEVAIGALLFARDHADAAPPSPVVDVVRAAVAQYSGCTAFASCIGRERGICSAAPTCRAVAALLEAQPGVWE